MQKLHGISFFIAALSLGAWALDTTIVYTGGRQSGTFKMDGRANVSSTSRTDVADTVRFELGLMMTRVVSKGGACILGCSYAVQTAIAFKTDSGSAVFRNDSNIAWNSALSFPAQPKPLDSIDGMILSPCFGGGPYGVGVMVSSDDASSVGAGCADKSTFRILGGHDRIVYFRKGDVFMKVQVAGFEIDSTDCVEGHPLYTCTRGDKIVFRYMITDDSTGYFGTDPNPIRSRGSPRRPSTVSRIDAWKSELYRMILGRRQFGSDKR